MSRKSTLITLSVILLATAGVLALEKYYPGRISAAKTFLSNPDKPKPVKKICLSEKFSSLKDKIPALKKEIKQRGFDERYCFIINMAINMGKERFFVYDLKNDSVLIAGLVTHGQGSGVSGKIEFSNKPNSYCTSLGHYKVGAPYYGKFGLAYKLYGLNATNSNAYNRAIVLHAHSCVPNEEVYPLNICESLGCPTVSPAFLQKLKAYIEDTQKPLMLSIYYELQ